MLNRDDLLAILTGLVASADTLRELAADERRNLPPLIAAGLAVEASKIASPITYESRDRQQAERAARTCG